MSTNHYINNKDFYYVLKNFLEKCNAAVERGEDRPVVPEYIGNSFIMLCENMAKRGNFNQYSWKDEMIGDGIENCMKALYNFSPDDTKKNPFGYFNMIIWRAFLRRIEHENNEAKVKFNMLSETDIEQILSLTTDDKDVYNYFIENARDKLDTDKTKSVYAKENDINYFE